MSFYAIRKWDLKTLTYLGEYVDIVQGSLVPIGDTTALWGGYTIDVSTMNVDKDKEKTNEYFPKTLLVGNEMLYYLRRRVER